MNTRCADWSLKLMEFVRARASLGYAWGTRDCVTLAADWVQVATGRDPALEYRGKYSSAIGAASLLGGPSFELLEDLATDRLGMPVDVRQAMRGDIMLLGHDRAKSLVICLGEQWVAQGLSGLAYGPRVLALKAWRV